MSLKRDQGPPRPREASGAWGDLCGLRGVEGSGRCLGAGPPRAPSASGAAPGPTRGGGGSIMAEVEETLKRIQSQKGVQGIIVVNSEGIPIKSTIDNATTIQYAGLMHSFIMKARSTVRDIDPQNDLTFLRIRSKKNEIMVAPDKDYFLIVIQNPTE
ncbi:LOW QUALITY PROTEIN: dynein light chain roadblock-type 1 [Molothrus aeneus]|uniref:LOW QUALITY PROTEIN: dynein light chain roadblock-type 1 n=1 Tax=Molothrus aeneus TaxID=84833 RepID=UPI0034588B4A